MNDSPHSQIPSSVECRAAWAQISRKWRTGFLRDHGVPPQTQDAFVLLLAKFESGEDFLAAIAYPIEMTHLELDLLDQTEMTKLTVQSRPDVQTSVYVRNGNWFVATA